jgi:hypothetical protein
MLLTKPKPSAPMLEHLIAEYGIYGDRKIPEIAGRYAGKNKSLAIVGDAACVWDDLEALGCAYRHMRGKVYRDGWDFMTINKIVEVFPGNIEHSYSNQPHLLEKFIAARRQEYVKEFDGPRNTHSCNVGAKWLWPWGGHATSGLGATIAGVAMGYDQVVLCGVPLDDGPHNGEPSWRKCTFTNEAAGSGDSGVNRHWQRANALLFKGKVKSMSGRTKAWLGSP